LFGFWFTKISKARFFYEFSEATKCFFHIAAMNSFPAAPPM